MSLKLNERYPGRFNNPSAGYPQGSFKNRTSPTAKDGSYLEQDWANDKEGFFQRLLSQAGIVPNGLVDTAQTSQYFDAFLQLASAAAGLNSPRVDIASAANVNLSTGAPNTSNINITGTTNISGFTVGNGKTYLVRFAGILTVSNNASIVTQSGANIVTAPGDTCIIRATAANVVEILCYTPGVPQVIGYRQTYQDVTASRALATTYTNATLRPIFVVVSMTANASAGADTFAALVDGVTIYDLIELDSNFSYSFFLFVPAGSTYRFNATIAPTLRRVMEMRT